MKRKLEDNTGGNPSKKSCLSDAELPDFLLPPGHENFSIEIFMHCALKDEQKEQQFWNWIHCSFSSEQEKYMRDALVDLLEKGATEDNIYALLAGVLLFSCDQNNRNPEKGLYYLGQIKNKPYAMQIHASHLYILGGDENITKAIAMFEEASKTSPVAWHNMGFLYLDGKHLKKDYAKASAFFEAAADKGSSMAQYYLGRMHWNGFGYEKNREKAVTYLKSAASQGVIKAVKDLALHYKESQNKKNRLACLEQIVLLTRNPTDMFDAGCIALELRDYQKSVKYFKMAAGMENYPKIQGLALYALAMNSAQLLSLDYKDKEVKAYLKKAAEKEYVPAIGEFGVVLLDDIDPELRKNGYEYLNKAADAKPPHMRSLYERGKLRFNGDKGISIRQDYVKARYDFENCTKIYPQAWLYLGYIHEYGLGTPVDLMKALKYYHGVKFLKHSPVQELNITFMFTRLQKDNPGMGCKNSKYLESLVFWNFLRRFPLESMESHLKNNPQPSFGHVISQIKEAGCYTKMLEFSYIEPWKESGAMEEIGLLWNLFCDHKIKKCTKNSEEFFHWSFMRVNNKESFYRNLFEEFPQLLKLICNMKYNCKENPDPEEFLKNISEGLDSTLEMRSTLQTIETFVKKICCIKRAAFFPVCEKVKNNLPPEITKHILEDSDNTLLMPW